MRRVSMAFAATVLWTFSPGAPPGAAQSCTWGGTPTVPAPSATFLRSQREELRTPGRVAADADGNLFATDPGAGRVVVRNPFGRLIAVREGFRQPLAIAVDASGAIFLGEQETGSVSVLDADWSVRDQLGAGGGEFVIPTDVAMDPVRGEVYVADGGAHEIAVYDPAGARQRSFGGLGTAAGRLDFPAAVHVSAAGEVYVGDQNNDRVQVFDRDGNFRRCFGGRGGTSFRRRFGRIQGLTSDGRSRIYVADAFQGQVRVFDSEGAALATLGGFGELPGQLRTPMGVAIDRFNRLFVASLNNGRLEVFGIDDFSDPSFLPADVAVHPETLNRASRGRFVTVYLELPGTPLEQVDRGSITAGGVGAEPQPSGVGDHDRDGVPDLMVKVDRGSLLAALPDGPAAVVVAGMLLDGTVFEGSATVRVLGKHGHDGDDSDSDSDSEEEARDD